MRADSGGVRVQPATAADVPRIVASRAGDPRAGAVDGRMAAYLQGRHHPQDALPPRVAYLALADGTVVGYIAGHLSRRFGCDGELQFLYVAPDFRRAGIATMLLRQLADWFAVRQATRICVDVNADSPAAGPFYSSRGAEPLRPHWMVWPDLPAALTRQR